MSSSMSSEFNLRTSGAIAQPVHRANLNLLDEQRVTDLIGRVSDKWTMIVIKILAEVGEIRFSHLSCRMHKVSTRTLIHTLYQMECDGLVKRLVPTVKPPRVDYRLMDFQLTAAGKSLGSALRNVWLWAEENLETISDDRLQFDLRQNR